MALIQLLQRLAALVSARDAVAVLLLAASFATTVCAFYRAPSSLRRHRLAIGAVALGAVVLFVASRGWLPIPILACMGLAAAAAFTLHSFASRQNGEDPAIEKPVPKHATALWIGVASILAACFLLAELGAYSGSLMTWEPESMEGLVAAAKNDVSWPRFAVSRLLWGQGLVSTGHDSLLFGSGTYALWKLINVSPATLRLMSLLLAAACLPAVYWVVKAVAGRPVAAASLVVIAVNPVLLFYGRYGASLTATFFAVLLLLGVFLRLLAPTRAGWRSGLVAAAAAFLATLGYATGRVVAVAVVMTTLFYGAMQWRRLERDRRRLFLVLVSALMAIWIVQAAFDRSRDFVNVNREHILISDLRPEWVEELLGEDADPERVTLRHRLILTRMVVADALVDMRKVLSYPFVPSTHPWLVLRDDPPEFPIAQGSVLLFGLWGFSLSLAVWRRRWPLLLGSALAAASLPLLLTNRVDIHRMSLTVLPIVVWAAMGLVTASHVMRDCRVPSAARHVVAAILLMLVAADNSTFLFYPKLPPRSRLVSAVQTEVDSIQESVAVGIANDWRAQGEIGLLLLDRRRLDPGDQSELLWTETVDALTDDDGPDAMTVVQIEGMLHDVTVILAPHRDFDAAISKLQARGMRARSIGEQKPGMWRLDRLPRGRLPDVEAPEPSPDQNPRPRRMREAPQTSIRLRFPLIETEVRDVYYASESPQFETAHKGAPVELAGGLYEFGIAMRAWTHMEFAVPFGAVALEAVIGIADAVSDCDQALATFEVWDENGRRIFDSGPVGAGMAPRHIRVPLDHTSTITLVVTEGGNGQECDQVLWAEPFFEIAR